jgi:hypothetical protein
MSANGLPIPDKHVKLDTDMENDPLIDIYNDLCACLDTIIYPENFKPNTLISLISLHKLINGMQRHQTSDGVTYEERMKQLNVVENFSGDRDELYDISGLDMVPVVSNGASKNTELTQDSYYDMISREEETPFYSNKKEIGDFVLNKKELVSQDFDCSKDYILTSTNSQPYVPFCDINKLKKERSKLREKTLDLSFTKSLRNDYDYLDE